jgi:hypothetical protein
MQPTINLEAPSEVSGTSTPMVSSPKSQKKGSMEFNISIRTSLNEMSIINLQDADLSPKRLGANGYKLDIPRKESKAVKLLDIISKSPSHSGKRNTVRKSAFGKFSEPHEDVSFQEDIKEENEAIVEIENNSVTVNVDGEVTRGSINVTVNETDKTSGIKNKCLKYENKLG